MNYKFEYSEIFSGDQKLKLCTNCIHL